MLFLALAIVLVAAVTILVVHLTTPIDVQQVDRFLNHS